MADPLIYYPKKDFPKYKAILHERAVTFFDELVKRSGVDEESNRRHVKEYLHQRKIEENARKKLGSSKVGLGFAIFGIIALFFTSFILVFIPFFNMEKLWWFFLIASISLGGAITLLVFTIVKISRAVKNNSRKYDEERRKSQELLDICYKDLEPLNYLYDYNIPSKLMDEVIDVIKIDDTVDNIRVSDLIANYNFKVESDKNSTTMHALSGEMMKNPFLLVETKDRYMFNKTYTGSIVVSVRVRRTDSKGRSYWSTEMETLVATTIHPAPGYSHSTNLFYANEAAPTLSFTHRPSHAEVMSDAQREKDVKSKIKNINKLADKALKNANSNFTPTGNDAFDVYFGGTDRNNEVQFRLLFDPLAQQNMMSLITEKEPFGDDFTFRKTHKINCIKSEHSQTFAYFIGVDKYRNYDIDAARNFFIGYVDDYFKNLYFDFAPLLSIPMYQIHKGKPVKSSSFNMNYSFIEHETMANSLRFEAFRPKKSNPTQAIMLSFMGANRVGNIDVVSINASSYQLFSEVDYIPRMARDGVSHIVPVPWTRYEEVNEEKTYGLYYAPISLQKFREKFDQIPDDIIDISSIHFERGLMAFHLKGDVTISLSEKLDKIFKN